MILDEREMILKKISRTLSIMMCDIKLHQSMNMFSININAEDFFCNVFNFLYPGKNFRNANSAKSNEAYIDLIDDHSKHLIQITTSTNKVKIDNSLKVFEQSNKNYNQYEFEIYYLLEKPSGLKEKTIKSYEDKYGIVDINDHLNDSTDLLNDIKVLADDRLEKIYKDHFRDINEKYTDEIALQIVFDALIKSKKVDTNNYESDFNNEDLDDKIEINSLNNKVANELHKGSEASLTIYELPDSQALSNLKDLVVNQFYAKIIKSALQDAGVKPKLLAGKKIKELHNYAKSLEVCFNKILGALCHRIEKETFKADYQATSMAWIIIAYFFEECDIGRKK